MKKQADYTQFKVDRDQWLLEGSAELDWNERCPIATLTYWGKDLTLDRVFSSELDNFSFILRDCDTVNFSAEGKNFKLLMSFDLGNPNPAKS